MRTHTGYLLLVMLLTSGAVRAQQSTYTLTGIIANEEGAPLYEAQVAVFAPGEGALLAYAYTDSSGQYTLDFSTGVSTGVEAPEAGQGFALGPAYPNPATAAQARVRIPYSQPDHLRTPPELHLFDVLGRRVNPGEVLAAGVYFYRVRFAGGPLSAARRFVFEGGRLSVELERVEGRANPLRAALSAQAAFPVVIAYPGYYEHREEVLLEAGAANRLDVSLVPVRIFGQATIGPEGGTLADTTGRVILEVPPGALAAPTDLVVRSAVDTTDNPWLFKGTVIDLEPDGLTFATPATLTFHYDSLAVPYLAADKPFAILTEDSTGWRPLDGEVTASDPGTLSGPIDHFSRKAAGVRYYPQIYYVVVGYKSSFGVHTPVRYFDIEIDTCKDGECSPDDTTSEISPTSLPPWGSRILDPDCVLESTYDEPVTLTGWLEHRGVTTGIVAYGFDVGNDFYMKFLAIATCPFVEVADHNVFVDGLAILDLGEIDPFYPEGRRLQIVISNTSEIPFDLLVEYDLVSAYLQWETIELVPPNIGFNHGLQECGEPFAAITPFPKIEVVPDPPDQLEAWESGTDIYTDVRAPWVALWVGLRLYAVCSSNYGDDPDTIGYGTRVRNDSAVSATIFLKTRPRPRQGCSGNCARKR